jgi:hypothetical protein
LMAGAILRPIPREKIIFGSINFNGFKMYETQCPESEFAISFHFSEV